MIGIMNTELDRIWKEAAVAKKGNISAFDWRTE
jgi:hypothetical protein